MDTQDIISEIDDRFEQGEEDFTRYRIASQLEAKRMPLESDELRQWMADLEEGFRRGFTPRTNIQTGTVDNAEKAWLHSGREYHEARHKAMGYYVKVGNIDRPPEESLPGGGRR